MMNIIQFVNNYWNAVRRRMNRMKYKNIHNTSYIGNISVSSPNNLIMEENTSIQDGAIILNTRAKFIMKKNSGAAVRLIVATGNHLSVVGMHYKQVTDKVKDELDINHKMDKNVIVGEDVWIGGGVTLLSGVCIGRGCKIGAGSVVRHDTPPYSVVIGNPAKVVKFRFTPEQVIEHEKVLYKENERFSIEILQKNYEEYYLNRLDKIKEYINLFV